MLVICPKVELPSMVFGSEKWRALNALNASNRNSMLSRSRIRSDLNSERSKFHVAGAEGPASGAFTEHVECSRRFVALYCHPRDEHNPVLPKHLTRAASLYEPLSTVPRKSDVWPALRAFWAALVSYQADYRYPLFWQGLESLFGSDDDTRRIRWPLLLPRLIHPRIAVSVNPSTQVSPDRHGA